MNFLRRIFQRRIYVMRCVISTSISRQVCRFAPPTLQMQEMFVGSKNNFTFALDYCVSA